ncbi:hypothetical protein NAPIS_ORF01199 [Vairimorpha apis BRL 01]|uniref:PH domain-containing protein n=1 Tax=Vairimorpha apis BRL 01 TaxID=1037528 RepID=T0L9V5_9MICR|nr:hypothetical protein NAPIS_ORF01199 [Vairimorpha apis BRL 01]
MSTIHPDIPTNKVKLINDEFKNKYKVDEELVYDFNSNKYSSTSRVQDLIRKYNSKCSNREYLNSGKNFSNNSNREYKSNRECITSGTNNSIYNNSTPFSNKSSVDCMNTVSNNPIYTNNNSTTFTNGNSIYTNNNQVKNTSIHTLLSNTKDQSPIPPITSTPLNIPNLNPINVIYTPRKITHPLTQHKQDPISYPTTSIPLYGPSIELTFPIKFTILNTIFDFNQNEETTIYYFKISSNIEWIIFKTLKQIKEILYGYDLSYSYCVYDKQIRDDIICSIFNNLYKCAPVCGGNMYMSNSGNGTYMNGNMNNYMNTNNGFINTNGNSNVSYNNTNGNSNVSYINTNGNSNNTYTNMDNTYSKYNELSSTRTHSLANSNLLSFPHLISSTKQSSYSPLPVDTLQHFILTNITKNIKYKGNYLLINKRPYLCKLVGKALVSYNTDNRVHKLFLLDECKIEMDLSKSYSFTLIYRKGVYEMSGSCMKERDEWVKEIQLFINKR